MTTETENLEQLQIINLSIRAADKWLVEKVSLTLRKGRISGLIGASGCGKSLTCQSLLGLVPRELQVSGELRCGPAQVALNDQPALCRSRLPNAGLAIILQNPMSCFNPVYRISYHFRETGKAHGYRRKDNCPARWRELLTDVGIEDPQRVLGLFPFQLSGGMLQRIMIALALMVRADYLLADEATTDLDPVVQAQILDLLETIAAKRNMGVLLVSHDLAVIARLASELLVMKAGRIIEQGTTEELFAAPAHPYTQALLDAHLRLYQFAEMG